MAHKYTRYAVRRWLLPLATSILFSGSYVAGKYTTFDLEPLTTTLARYVVALVVLTALLPLHGREALRLEPRDLARVVLLGVFGIIGYHYFFFLSLRYTEVANTAIINALSPVVTGVLAAAFIGERLGRRSYAGVAVACAGVLALLCDGDLASLLAREFNRGDLLMLLSVLCWAVYALLVKTLLERYSSYTLTLYATLFGVLILLAVAALEHPLDQIRAMSRASLHAVLYMGAAASGLAYLLYNLSIGAIAATRTSSFVYSSVPVFVAGLALGFFAEPVTLVTAASVVAILVGLRLLLAPPPGQESSS